jgi:hypothetical protein
MMDNRDLFKYTEDWNHNRFFYFSQLTDEFFDEIITTVNAKRKEIHKLKRVPITVLKNDISPSTYKILESNHVDSMFDLCNNLTRLSTNAVISRLPCIGPKKGDEILRAMKKAGYPKSSSLRFGRAR